VVRIDDSRSPWRASHGPIPTEPTARELTPTFTRREFGREHDERFIQTRRVRVRRRRADIAREIQRARARETPKFHTAGARWSVAPDGGGGDGCHREARSRVAVTVRSF